MNRVLRRLAVSSIAALLSAGSARAADGKRIFISVDMEGITGVVTGDQLGPTGFEYARVP